MAFLLFGNQSPEAHDFFANLCRQGDLGLLANAFVKQAGRALKDEVDQLAKSQRVFIPTFRSLQQLNEQYFSGPHRHSGVENALLCAAQLTYFIDRCEKHPEDASAFDKSFLIGLGPGLFAAAAVACSQSPQTMIAFAVRAVVLCFRLGLYIDSSAEPFKIPGESTDNWTVSCSGATEEEVRKELLEFNTTKVSEPSQAYISAVAAESIEISGPPSTLRSLGKQPFFSQRLSHVETWGPYYASHLHSHVEMDHVLRLDDDPTLVGLMHTVRPRYAVMSHDGTWLTDSDVRSLLKAIGYACLNTPFNTSTIIDHCVDIVQVSGQSHCLVVPHSPEDLATKLAKAITEETSFDVTLRMHPKASSSGHKGVIGSHGSVGRTKLAIVGMSGRFPDAASHDALWELLCKGLDVHRVVPKDRFNADTHVDSSGKAINTSHTPYGCWIKEPGLFDPRFFNMSPREALQTDPMQRLGIVTAYEALEMAGYVPNRTPSTCLDRIGTFYGQTSDDWREINAAQEIDTYFITGGVRAFGPGRINYHFGFSGPSLNIDTACSSSAAALQVACTSLWANDCDTAIVGGLSVLGNPDIFSGLSRGQFLSKTGPCATFDNAADGYCRADGCASVIVKRLDDALQDKDNVLAVILGTATNHSADAISITHPHGPTQSTLSRTILDEAGVDPLDVDYVEMHGTGTQAGDGTEMVSVTNVFAPADRKRPADRPLYIGAVKANVGHGEAASGVTALCKVLMMLQKNVIPPHVGIKKGSIMNVTFPKDLSDRNVNIAMHMTPLQRSDGRPRKIFVNNFSAAGGNTGLLLEDAPVKEPSKPDPRPVHVIAVTAKSKAAMTRNAERLVSWMAQNPDTPLSHVAYTTTARKIQHYWRMNVTASTLEDAQVAIKKRLQDSFSPITSNASSSGQPPIVFSFTGQGSHYAGMGKDLYAHFSVFRDSINTFEGLARMHGFPSFLSLIDGSEPDLQSMSPVVVQLGICCIEMAMVRLWASWGIRPDAVIGHSLGEYAALNSAGVLSANDTIVLVGKRAQLLCDECTPGTHAMLAVQAPVSGVQEYADKGQLDIACINGPRETVLSGEADKISKASDIITRDGLKCTLLKVPFAFHSAQVDPILNELEKVALTVQLHKPRIDVISPYSGRVINDQSIDASYLCGHARQPVDFFGSLTSAQEAKVIDQATLWIEIGPHSVCSNMIKATFGVSTVAVPTLRRGEETYKTLSTSLCALHSAGLNLDWNEFHRDFSESTRLLDLPAYSFDDKNYWIQYEGDWTLTKNRAPKQNLAAIEVPKPKLSTTSVHEVTKEVLNGDNVMVETCTNLSREDIRPVVMGHLCNGIPLCPSTLYADMAMTVCDYAYKLAHPDSSVGLNVAEVEVPKTLIFDEKLEAHELYCTVEANISRGDAKVIFHTFQGKAKTEHAFCKVIFGKLDTWASEFERAEYLIKSRVDTLIEAEKVGKASKIGRGLAYKLFAALVDYDPKYRGMEEVILDSDTCEATAKVTFQTTEQDGNFFFNPYWIDSCCHISGFIINGTDAVDSREQVFISHGWGSLRFLHKLDPKKSYRSYIRMQPVKGTKVMAGDAYVFDGDHIVGIAGDVRFQSIPRKVLNLVLPPRGAAASGSAAKAKPTPAPAPVQKVNKEKAKKANGPNLGAVNTKLGASITTAFMDILQKEVGCDADELVDNIAFADLGCDSLMALTVAGRMREELEVDIESHQFLEHSTIGAFKKAVLAPLEPASSSRNDTSVPVEEPGTSSGFDSEVSSTSDDTTITTPSDESDVGSIKGDDGGSSDLVCIVRDTIASEMGVDVDEVLAAPDLTALGMDSLMSLTILGALREKTGLTIDNDLFTNNSSLNQVEKALGVSAPPKPKSSEPKKSKMPASWKPVAPTTVINTTPGNTTARIKKPPPPSEIVDYFPHRKASSVLLQGNIRTAKKQLFMIPDGSGSATSYTEIGQVSPDWAVWGLFSPFMKTPEEFTCGVYGIAAKFIQEMKKRQPTGPYSLAGWSAGGVAAFEMLNQLTRAGEQVEHLIIIDAPCPVTIEPLPKSLHAWFASIGLLGDGDDETEKRKVPEWLLPHFAASVTALSNYTAVRIPSEKCPKVMTIWCEDGVCKTPTDPRPDPYPTGHALFLLDNRTDFGPNRWDEYLDIGKFQSRHMPGNHFSMMHGEYARMLGGFMREALMF